MVHSLLKPFEKIIQKKCETAPSAQADSRDNDYAVQRPNTNTTE